MRIVRYKVERYVWPTKLRYLCGLGLLSLLLLVVLVILNVIPVGRFLWTESRTIGHQLFVALALAVVVAPLGFLIRGLFSKRRVQLPRLAIGRDVLRFSNQQLRDVFHIIGNARPIPFGYKTYGVRESPATWLTYKKDSDREQTASALFKPVVRGERHSYWRAGIALFHDEVELVKFHIDNSQFVLLLVHGQRAFKYVWPAPFNNRWHSLRVCVSPQEGRVDILCYLDETLVGVHSISTTERKFFPVFQVWSDQYRDHLVYIKDLWVQQGGVTR